LGGKGIQDLNGFEFSSLAMAFVFEPNGFELMRHEKRGIE